MRVVTFVLAWILVGSYLLDESFADWPQFRGPAGNGQIGELNHPVQWSMEQNLAWSRPIPGGGWASPIVVGERVFVTAAVDEKLNEHGYIVPGLGDAGDRMFGKK